MNDDQAMKRLFQEWAETTQEPEIQRTELYLSDADMRTMVQFLQQTGCDVEHKIVNGKHFMMFRRRKEKKS